MIGTNTTTGVVIDYEAAGSSNTQHSGRAFYYRPIVEYKINNSSYRFKGAVGDFYFYTGEVVPVIYKQDRSEARIYSFLGFWLPFYEIAFVIILTIVAIAASYSFIDSKEGLVIGLGKKIEFKKQKMNSNEHESLKYNSQKKLKEKREAL